MALRLSDSFQGGAFRLACLQAPHGPGEHVGQRGHQDAVRLLAAVKAGWQDGASAAMTEHVSGSVLIAELTLDDGSVVYVPEGVHATGPAERGRVTQITGDPERRAPRGAGRS